MGNTVYPKELIEKLNADIKKHFPHLFLVDQARMFKTFSSVSRLVMLDRYSQKDINHVSLGIGDLVLVVIKDDPKFPTRGIGNIVGLNDDYAYIKLETEYAGMCEDLGPDNIIKRKINEVDKPLELFYEQICHRVANNLAQGETLEVMNEFYRELNEMNVIPPGGCFSAPVRRPMSPTSIASSCPSSMIPGSASAFTDKK